jgi:hypothetical protein
MPFSVDNAFVKAIEETEETRRKIQAAFRTSRAL